MIFRLIAKIFTTYKYFWNARSGHTAEWYQRYWPYECCKLLLALKESCDAHPCIESTHSEGLGGGRPNTSLSTSTRVIIPVPFHSNIGFPQPEMGESPSGFRFLEVPRHSFSGPRVAYGQKGSRPVTPCGPSTKDMLPGDQMQIDSQKGPSLAVPRPSEEPGPEREHANQFASKLPPPQSSPHNVGYHPVHLPANPLPEFSSETQQEVNKDKMLQPRETVL